ncbi:MAG: NfeD family protein [Deltaproteobacteria bacterium]|nr:NfeD family protein [Deltaproteobacteria bacterium]
MQDLLPLLIAALLIVLLASLASDIVAAAAGTLGPPIERFLERIGINLKLGTPSPQSTGIEAILGAEAVVSKDFEPRTGDGRYCGKVRIGGELWKAELIDTRQAPPKAGSRVVIAEIRGTTLLVNSAPNRQAY